MYKIMGIYQGEREEVDSFDTRKEAQAMLREYQMAFGAGWSLWIKRSRQVGEAI